jgi:hypothetical protein
VSIAFLQFQGQYPPVRPFVHIDPDENFDAIRFMTNINDDVRLPFSVLDPIVGDVFSVRWEPEMMGETGNALRILSTEVLSQVSTTVLQATVLTALMGALQWPLRA